MVARAQTKIIILMTTESTSHVLKVNDLTIGYRSKKTVRKVASEISFSLPKGQLISLVGVNGVGKSTLLRTLSGMQPALSGSIEVNQDPLNAYDPIQLATQLSVVLTEVPASKNLTVRELVSLGRQPHTNWMGSLTAEDESTIDEALQRTDLTELADRKCYELSDGQLQRVYIARAIAQDTPMILLDEPTTHLDLFHRASILKLLKDLSAISGKTILFSTHEIDLAIQISDAMILMTPNKIEFDTPCQLITKGSFAELFPKDTIEFDALTGRFSVKK